MTTKSPMFQQRHYEAIARVMLASYTYNDVAKSPEKTSLFNSMVREMCMLFESDNRKFVWSKFREASKGESE